jgi:hypothetical protein
MSNSTFDFNVFIKESKDTLVNPKSYFSTMKTTGGIAEPLIKAVIYGVAAGLIAFIWSLLKLGGAGAGMFGGAVGIGLFIYYIVAAIIGLFIGAVLILIVSAICKGSTDFEANVRVSASLMVVMPITALFGFVSGFNLVAGSIVGLLINLYALYMLYHALVEALKAKPETTRILVIVLVVLMALFLIIGIGAKKKANQFMNEFNNTDLKELIEDAQNN